MNNEPVAWMSNGKEFYVQKNYCPDFIPLYTHPVKELTDEEIKEIFSKNFPITDKESEVAKSYFFILKCCIKDALRKAQEK